MGKSKKIMERLMKTRDLSHRNGRKCGGCNEETLGQCESHGKMGCFSATGIKMTTLAFWLGRLVKPLENYFVHA